MSYTKGPWIPSKHGFQVLTHDSEDAICQLDIDLPEMKANSRLIAATPELLEALQTILNWANDPDWSQQTGDCIHAADVKALVEPIITKALGKTS